MTKWKSLAIGLVLTVASLGATAPAQAQSFGFSIGSGGSGLSFGIGESHRFGRVCVTERELRNRVGQEGYTNIFVNVAIHNRIQVRATRGDWVYLLDVNACTGRILGRERLRRS